MAAISIRNRCRRCPSRGATGARCCCWRPGAAPRSDTVARINSRNTNRTREFQTNVDGQQFQNTMGGGGQPAFSQEMIAEFQYISNRFDATQGRSSGLQVNLVTKSGTNRYAGSFRSNFRDDRFNAPNPILHRVTPIQNQQYASTFGGPIVRNRLHFFASTSTSASRKKRPGVRPTRDSTSRCRARPERRSAAPVSTTSSRRRAA